MVAYAYYRDAFAARDAHIILPEQYCRAIFICFILTKLPGRHPSSHKKVNQLL
jgi:hypothetical protein